MILETTSLTAIIAIVTAGISLVGTILTPLAIAGGYLIKNVKSSKCLNCFELQTYEPNDKNNGEGDIIINENIINNGNNNINN
jgi:hypothetical protein